MATASTVTRRGLLGTAGLTGAGLLLAGTPGSRIFGADEAFAATCVTLAPVKSIGPYFVEEKLNRSDITTDPTTGVASVGIALVLNFALVDEANGCAPFAGAQVDIWHADANGKYSDEASEGTAGKKFLRGYQVSDAAGKVTFKTIFPGWYSGRTVHIHARFRLFDASGSATYDFVTQIFFDDAVADQIYARAPYNTRGTRTTRNTNDNIYGTDGASLLVPLTADASGGYVGAFTCGLSRTNQGGGSAAGPGGDPGGGPPPGAPAASDTTVGATLAAPRWTKSKVGLRTLVASVTANETISLNLRILRGTRTLARKRVGAVAAGTHTLKVPLGTASAAGRATLEIVATDGHGNKKVLTRIIQILPRSAA